jgi:hypothetical protein
MEQVQSPVRTVLLRIEFVAWLVIVVASSIAVLVLTRAATSGREVGADHPLFVPLTLGLIVIVALAGLRVPRFWWSFALGGYAPWVAVALGIGVNLTAEQRAFAMMNVVWSLPFLLVLVVSAFIGSRIRLGTRLSSY